MPVPAPIRDLTVGRLGLPTVFDPIVESLGSEVTNVGESTAVGQRKAKGFTLSFPVHGTPGDLDLQATGMRMRRQLRSMMQNPAYRLAGVYVQFAWDPERNGWLVIGEGELADDNGGVPFAEFKLTLSQAFLVAALRTHREGYMLELTDLRAADSPCDYFGEQIGLAIGFAGLQILPLVFLPAAASSPTVREQPLPGGAREGRDGGLLVLAALTDGDVVAWDRAESNFNRGDVVIYDRRIK